MQPRTTMAELVDLYLARRAGQLAPKSLIKHRTRIGRLARWWDGTSNRKAPKSMRPDDLERYVWGPHECGRGCYGRGRFHDGPGLRKSSSEATFNSAIGMLRDFLTWAVRLGHISADVLDVVSLGEAVKLPRRRRLRLNPDQLADVIEGTPDPWTRIVCALAVFTAGRSSELLTLTLSNVDMDRGLIEWNRHKTGDDEDSIPITSDLAEELARWFKAYEAVAGRLQPHHYLIPQRVKLCTPGRVWVWKYVPDQPRGGRLHDVVKEQLARALSCPVSDLKGEGVHTLRRSMARALYERLRAESHGDPVGVVQSLLGHTQRSMTERYIGVESGRMERDSLLKGRSMFG